MEYFFTFTITRTVITLDPNQPVDTETITTDPIRVLENDQKSVKVFFDEVVNNIIPPGMELVNYVDPQLFNPLQGFRSLIIYDLNATSIQSFISNFAPTYLHPGRPDSPGSPGHSGRTHFAFMINVVVRQRAPL